MLRWTLRQRLIGAILLIGFIILSISILNVFTLRGQKRNLLELAHWGDIDMTMNEEVLAKFSNLEIAFLHLKDRRDLKAQEELKKAFREAQAGIKNWKNLVSQDKTLYEAALRWEEILRQIQDIISSYQVWAEKRETSYKILKKNKEILRDLLETSMEEKIDPAKEKAARSGDIKKLAKWSDIDMVMNEEITQRFFAFELALGEFLSGRGNAQQVDRELSSLKQGLAHWNSLVKGIPFWEEVANKIYSLVESDQEEWLKIKDISKKLKEICINLKEKIQQINREAEFLMDRKIDTAKENVIKEALTSAEKDIKVSIIQVGIGVIIILFIIWGSNAAYRPLQALIDRLKDLAVGETDLTKQLDVRAINCSEMMGCSKTACPCYGREAHCWYEAGSYAPIIHCPRIKKGEIKSCEECEVYQKAIITEIDEVSTFVNAFIRRVRRLVERVKRQSEKVAREARKLSDISEALANGAENTLSHAQEVSQAVESMAESIYSVATAMEEMTATVSEIAQHTTQTSQVAEEAKEEVLQAEEVIQNLAKASNQINEVSKLIGSIADQTSLLALNATIEAARAGEAGKGFTVVANEVKELAHQTGNSVNKIDNMVKNLQTGAEEAFKAMQEISKVIQQVAEFSRNVAAAVEEQTAMTNEVSANTQRVNEKVSDMARKSESIAAAGAQTAQGAEEVRSTAQKLRKFSDKLERLIGEFKV